MTFKPAQYQFVNNRRWRILENGFSVEEPLTEFEMSVAPSPADLFNALIDCFSNYIAAQSPRTHEEEQAQQQALFEMSQIIEGRLPPRDRDAG